jgi:pimeloyl-ACP methyl ester carboxylesterase
VPAPVLFVHGLWGDAASLSEINAYLGNRAPWQSRTILRRFAYDGALRFDHPATISTVASVIREIYDALDRHHIVGGRVDAVAHSMGGLVLRKFISTSGYRSLRTRRLGSLGQVVTLDTPQLGSALATYLLNHRNRHARHPEEWSFLCGDDKDTTVAQCFEANDLSLWGPVKGDPANSAVWSLVPGNSALAGAPRLSSNPDIRWTNVTSVLRGSDDSILRFAIEHLIRAIYVNRDNAPTPTEILGGLPNDVIVTWRSQSNGSLPANTPKFLGVAHSDFKQLNLPPIDNDAVVNSQRVFSYVECRLKRPAVACTPKTEPSATEEAASDSFDRISRLTVDAPLAVSSNAAIGMPLELSARIIGAARIKRVVVTQRNEVGDAAKADVVPFRISDGTLSFAVVPKLLGRVSFGVAVYRGDGTAGLTTITRDVTPPANQPTALLGDNPDHNIHVSRGSARILTPSGVFAGVEGEVPLSGEVAYRVLEGAENIRLERGRLFGVRAGSARIEARLGAAADVMTVTVDP